MGVGADPLTPLGVIPAYLREPHDLDVLTVCLRSIRSTAAGELDVLVVDDGSPAAGLVDALEAQQRALGFELVRRPENEGFSRTVNVGLRRALESGRSAILINADIEFTARGWVGLMEGQLGILNPEARAAVVGGLLLFPNGLIQHAGIYFSLLTRGFDHFYKYGPRNLPEAQKADARPVTGALQFIRHETLTNVGLYDEEFRMGFEDVDYCLRVLLSGRECVYQPKVRAYHHEGLFRGRKSEHLDTWHKQSLVRLWSKYRDQSFAGLVPTR